MRHILPNVMSHVVVATTLLIPSIILIESFLSFLGLGVQPPMISWGLLLNAAQNIQNLGSYPWVLAPVVGVLVAVMSFNMLGDGLARRHRPLPALRRRWMHATVEPHLVEVRNLSVRFKLDDAVVEAVRDISFHVDRGEMLALVGESGSGKSVTARAIMKLLAAHRDGLAAKAACCLAGDAHRQVQRAADARRARRPHLDDLPGADVVAEPDLPGRQPDRRRRSCCISG